MSVIAQMNIAELHADCFYHIDRRPQFKYEMVEEQYKCPYAGCNKLFKTGGKVSQHYSSKHHRKLKCPGCEYVNGNLHNMRSHYARKHCGTKKIEHIGKKLIK